MRIQRIGHEIIAYFRNPYTESAVKPPSKLQILIFFILLLVGLFLSLRNYNSFQLGSYWDDSEYAVLAQSITQSDSYGLINVPGDPAPSRYPIGFPLLLSVFLTIFPQMFEQMKVISLLSTLLSTTLLFWGWPYLSKLRSYWWGLIIAAIFFLSPLVIGHTRMVMSEPAFTAFMLIAFVLTEKNLTGDQKKPLQAFFVGLVAVFTYFIRTIGILLVVAIITRILMLGVKRSLKLERFLFMILGGVVFILIVISITPITLSELLPSNIYFEQFDNPEKWGVSSAVAAKDEDPILTRLFPSIIDYFSHQLRVAALPIGGGIREIEFSLRLGIPSLPLIIGLTVGTLILLGSLLFYKRQGLAPAVLLFEVFYLGALLLWPFRGVRLLYPILPFLVFQFLQGICLIIDQIRRIKFFKPSFVHNLSNCILTTAVSIILLASVYKGATDNRNTLDYSRDLRVGAEWIKENSPIDSRVMAQQPSSIYLYSHRKTINQYRFQSRMELQESLAANNIDYILVAPKLEAVDDGPFFYDSYTREKFLPMIKELLQMGELKLVFYSSEDMVSVYQMVGK